MQTVVKWNISKIFSLQQDANKQTIKNHLKHIWYGFKTYKPFPLQVLRLVIIVSFDLIKWKLCWMWLWARRPPQRPQPHEVNQAWLFGPLFYLEVLHKAKCGANHFLWLDSYSSQWRSYSRCMWPKVHITNVDICSTCISQVGVHMDQFKVRVHHEANLWQAQRNLAGTGKCRWINDMGWFPTTPRYHLLGPKA